jgi:deazaflavin-dependent oxidoreductase (nitroreductase family)
MSRNASHPAPNEPWAAHLHFVARAIRGPQEALVSVLRRDVERSAHWVLLTTRGRKTGLPREVLLPCARDGNRVLVVSTYGWRSAWVRNIEACPDVELTSRGKKVKGRAEIVDDVERKQVLAAEMPFVPLAPIGFAQSLARGALRGPAVAWLKQWVTPRPVVVIEVARGAAARRRGASRLLRALVHCGRASHRTWRSCAARYRPTAQLKLVNRLITK